MIQTKILIKSLELSHIPVLVDAFQKANWQKPASLFEMYYQEQQDSERVVWVAYVKEEIAGYVTLKSTSQYEPFIHKGIPEIMDLNVLPDFRKLGIGSALLTTAEEKASSQYENIGIGVGLYGGFDGGYGQAQRLYVNRGYIPDGLGVTYGYKPTVPGQSYPLDDNLILWFTKKLKKNFHTEEDSVNKTNPLLSKLADGIVLINATRADYPIIQNMARFYVYDLSRECGFISEKWSCLSNGLYESSNFKCYFEEPSRRAYLIKFKQELAGFVLLNKEVISPETDWNMGEFFILAKFQGKGIAQYVAHQLWSMLPGLWEISVIPENVKALNFWRKAVSKFSKGNYLEKMCRVAYDAHQPKRHVLSFQAKRHID